MSGKNGILTEWVPFGLFLFYWQISYMQAITSFNISCTGTLYDSEKDRPGAEYSAKLVKQTGIY